MDLGDITKYLFIGIIILLIGIFMIPGIYTDLLWFNSLGFSNVIITILSTRLSLAILSAITFFIILYLNWRITKKILEDKGENIQKTLEKIIPSILGIISLIAGIIFSSQWNTVLKFLNANNFNILDPVFQNDISFYIFHLPFYKSITGFLIAATILSLIISFTTYLTYTIPFGRRINVIGDIADTFLYNPKQKDKTRTHLYILAGCFFILSALWTWMSRYNILFSKAGAVFGAAYTDINVTLPFATITAFITAIVGILFLIQNQIKKP
ncbi:MAG: UPF0182 family protein, partial [Candidatus Thermoplasmatota archaeon]